MKDFFYKIKKSFKLHWGEFIREGKICLEEFKNPKTRKKQIPNLFTAARLLAPFFIIPTALLGNLPLTGIFVVGFTLTDAADGYFARKYDSTSEFGRKLDALTDKLFAASLLIPLIFTNPILLAIFTMEGVISGINVYSQLSDNTPKTEYIGKIKTFSLFSTIGLYYVSLLTQLPSFILSLMTYSTIALQMLSAAKYLDVLTTKEHEKGIIESQENSQLNTDVNSDTNEKNKCLESETISPNTKNVELTGQEQVAQLKELRNQLTYQPQNEEAKQKKIGTKD